MSKLAMTIYRPTDPATGMPLVHSPHSYPGLPLIAPRPIASVGQLAAAKHQELSDQAFPHHPHVLPGPGYEPVPARDVRALKFAGGPEPWTESGDLRHTPENLQALSDWSFADEQPKAAARVCPKCGSDNVRAFEAHADTGYDEWEGKCRDCDHRGELREFTKKTAGILTFDEAYAAARRAPDYEATIEAMKASRDKHEGPAVIEFGDTCHTPDSFRDDSAFARTEARKHAAALGQMTPLQAAPDGGENHPPLIGNPFMGDDKSSTEYENGYQYAQSLGHQRLNVATEGDVARWQGGAKPWVAGFCAGARSLGAGRVADTIEQTKQGHRMPHFAIAHLEKTAGVLTPLATTLGGAALGGLLGGAAGQDQTNRAEMAAFDHAANQVDPTHVDPGLTTRFTDPATDAVRQLGTEIHGALPGNIPLTNATSGALGGAAIGAGTGLAGGLLLNARERRAAEEPKFASAHLHQLVAKAGDTKVAALGNYALPTAR